MKLLERLEVLLSLQYILLLPPIFDIFIIAIPSLGRLEITEFMTNLFRSTIALSPQDLLPAIYLAINRVRYRSSIITSFNTGPTLTFLFSPLLSLLPFSVNSRVRGIRNGNRRDTPSQFYKPCIREGTSSTNILILVPLSRGYLYLTESIYVSISFYILSIYLSIYYPDIGRSESYL